MKNVVQKKVRTALVVLAIASASSLFFACMSMSDSLLRTLLEIVRQEFGNMEIIVQADNESQSRYLDERLLDGDLDQIKEKVGIVEARGYYLVEDIKILNPIEIKSESQIDTEHDQLGCIISDVYATKYNLSIEDEMEVQIYDQNYTLVIKKIAKPVGLFKSSAELVILDKGEMQSMLTQGNMVSKLYVQLNDPTQIAKKVEQWQSQIPDFHVSETLSQENLKDQTQTFTTMLMLMLGIIVLMSSYIIAITFKVIAVERLPQLGTLRSIGASKKATNTMLMGESLMYGLAGGILGSIVGVVLLYVFAWQNSNGADVHVVMNVWQFPLTILVAMLIAFFSSLKAIMKTMCIPIKELVLNLHEHKILALNPIKGVLGSICLAIALIAPRIVSGEVAVVLDIVAMVCGVAGIILVIPFACKLIIWLVNPIISMIFGNVGKIASKNIAYHKPIMNNITLLAIGITSILMVNIVSKSTTAGILDFTQNTIRYDMTFSIPKMNEETIDIVKKVQGVENATGFYSMKEISTLGDERKLRSLIGIDTATFLEFNTLDVIGQGSQEALAQLNNGKNILLGSKFASRMGVKEGDKITLVLNRKEVVYEVVGILDIMQEDGSIAFVSEESFVKNTNIESYTGIYINAFENEDAGEVLEKVRNTFSKEVSSGQTMKDHQEHILSETGSIFTMMKNISLICMLIGILNNLTISFIQRQRQMAVLRSVGMSKMQLVKMVWIEGLYCGILGSGIGVFGGWIMISIAPYLTKAMIATIPMQYSGATFALAAGCGLLMTLIASLQLVTRSFRLEVVKSIKVQD